MAQNHRAKLTVGNIPTQLIKLTLPMIVGMIGMVVFNLTDTFFLGQLGTDQLAALSFTFPVVLIVGSLVKGIGMGTSAILSKYIGAHDMDNVKHTATNSLLLGLIISSIAVIIGLSTIRPLFSLLGAEGVILDYIEDYMSIWYYGTIMVVIPMIGNEIIRAMGDTKVPGLIMGVSAFVNIILDPILIFGYGPIPALGIQGAAIATVFARSITAVTSVSILYFREKIITFSNNSFTALIAAWQKILYIGIPNSLIQMALPVGAGIITRMLSSYGPNVVAGYGVATKIEFFAIAFANALTSVMGPFIGQNLGSKLFDRVKTGLKVGELYAMGSGIMIAILLSIFAHPIASIFNKAPEVVETTVLYIRIVSFSFGFQGILKISTTVLNVLNKPFHASMIIFIQTFALYIPLAKFGSSFAGLTGIFGALFISYFAVGILAHFLVRRNLQQYIQTPSS
ncbi:MATE family efflux transporter [Fusibacter paucivorans]|uniref:MATE family efflux transporter n=1 Tax=Fusibacter paucivorans TaxID=76009 RepID=A0ABS5PV39_9FIRM|nr:MATE family efflux transporter [Fusibacter paucivorans]MBS7528334.1 MATE family efflux transporter [Fusibacter paucivorans]